MLIKFYSPSSGPFITTKIVADQLISAMGKSDSLKGIVVSNEIDGIIKKIESHIVLEKNKLHSNENSKIGFSQRVFPLVEMLKKAKLENEFVIWDKL